MKIFIKRPMVLFSIIFAFIVFTGVSLFPPSVSEYAINNHNREIVLTGRLYKKEYKNYSVRLYLKDINKKIKVIAYTKLDEDDLFKLKLGSTITVMGKFVLFDIPENDGQFDSRSYYLIRGIEGSIKNGEIISIKNNNNGYYILLDVLYNLRCRFEHVFFKYLNEEDAGIMNSLLLGDKNELDSEIKDLYQSAGIAHILSLSGLHIAAVGLFLLNFLKKTMLPLWLCYLFSTLIMLLYAMMTGMNISTMRAFIMFCVSELSLFLSKSYDLLSSAAFSVVFCLAFNPFLILDTAFLLSFGAILAIAIVFPVLLEVFNNTNPFKKQIGNNSFEDFLLGKYKLIKESIILSLSVNLTTLPIVAASFYKISIFGFLINLVVIPLMALLLAFGFFGMFFGSLILYVVSEYYVKLTEYLAYVNKLSFKITHVILTLYKMLCQGTTSLYGNTLVTGKPEPHRVVIYYILLVITLVFGGFIKNNGINNKNVDLNGLLSKGLYKKYQVKLYNSQTSVTKVLNKVFYKFRILVKVFIILLIFISVVIITNKNISEIEIKSFSVGQGDCSLIYGKDSPVILVDGGSSDIKNVGKYRVIPALLSNGISSVDYMCVSHFDDDHYNGLLEILEDEYCGIKVKNILITNPANIRDKEIISKINYFCERARRNGSKIYIIKKGDVILDKKVKISCLWSGLKENLLVDNNNSSMVLRFDFLSQNSSALFTGDISSEVEKELIKDVIKSDILKVPHHGSKYSSSKEFLNSVNPAAAIISCGYHNSYGHPHKEVLDRFSENSSKCTVFRTDYQGQISFSLDNRRLCVKTNK